VSAMSCCTRARAESLALQELDAVTPFLIAHGADYQHGRKVLESQNANIVVLRADDQQFGLVVDEINDTEEIVVKPLSKQLKSINTYAGPHHGTAAWP